ncbi:MAG: DUF4912 domain-containing protein [Chitinispirillales bacterium]|jgi:hypothetical protein|nr:DUF4912 domain-containing protein [Chitinispirillales bacterium]
MPTLHKKNRALKQILRNRFHAPERGCEPVRQDAAVNAPAYTLSTDIPKNYNDTYMRAIPQDPQITFVYWEITSGTGKAYMGNDDAARIQETLPARVSNDVNGTHRWRNNNQWNDGNRRNDDNHHRYDGSNQWHGHQGNHNDHQIHNNHQCHNDNNGRSANNSDNASYQAAAVAPSFEITLDITAHQQKHHTQQCQQAQQQQQQERHTPPLPSLSSTIFYKTCEELAS